MCNSRLPGDRQLLARRGPRRVLEQGAELPSLFQTFIGDFPEEAKDIVKLIQWRMTYRHDTLPPILPLRKPR